MQKTSVQLLNTIVMTESEILSLSNLIQVRLLVQLYKAWTKWENLPTVDMGGENICIIVSNVEEMKYSPKLKN